MHRFLSYGITIWAELSFTFTQFTRLTDGQTDGRTDGFKIAKTVLHNAVR